MFTNMMMIALPAVVLGYDGKATFFNNPNFAPGSCGFGFSDSEFIAALSGDMMPGYKAPNCNRMARAVYKGKSVTVKIVDTCPTCEKTSLDLSPAAFQALEHPDVGLIDIKWEFMDGQVKQHQEKKKHEQKKEAPPAKQFDNPNHKESQMPQTSESANFHKGNISWTKSEPGCCGTSYSDSDLVVAISEKIFNASLCGRMINLYAGEKKARVKVVDTCKNCTKDELVLSKAAFEIFTDLEHGIFEGKWKFESHINTSHGDLVNVVSNLPKSLIASTATLPYSLTASTTTFDEARPTEDHSSVVSDIPHSLTASTTTFDEARPTEDHRSVVSDIPHFLNASTTTIDEAQPTEDHSSVVSDIPHSLPSSTRDLPTESASTTEDQKGSGRPYSYESINNKVKKMIPDTEEFDDSKAIIFDAAHCIFFIFLTFL